MGKTQQFSAETKVFKNITARDAQVFAKNARPGLL